MKINEIITKLSADAIHIGNENVEINSGYAGDFLSFVMGKAPTDCAWFTVMNNVNVAAVALLAEIGVIVCCEGVKADSKLIERVQKENLNLITTKLDIYNAILAFSK